MKLPIIGIGVLCLALATAGTLADPPLKPRSRRMRYHRSARVKVGARRAVRRPRREDPTPERLRAATRPKRPAAPSTRPRLRERRSYQVLKRCIDIVGASVGLVLGSPVMLAIAIAILIESGRPVFYCARRVAQGGNPISVVKFRTMQADAERILSRLLREPRIAAEYRQNFKLRQDPRCTRLGRFLRRTSLDELPQLWNVLVGAMSLVGPRPIVAEELPLYRSVPDGEAAYLAVKPGITGLWQVSGRNETTYEERVRLDVEYVRKRSLLADLRILLRTPGAALTGV